MRILWWTGRKCQNTAFCTLAPENCSCSLSARWQFALRRARSRNSLQVSPPPPCRNCLRLLGRLFGGLRHPMWPSETPKSRFYVPLLHHHQKNLHFGLPSGSLKWAPAWTRAQFSAFELGHFCVSKSSSFGIISEDKGPHIFTQALHMVPKGLQHDRKLTSQMQSFTSLSSFF